MDSNQSAPEFNRGLSSNFCWLRSAKCEIYERMCDALGKACFNQKILYKWVEYVFATTILSGKVSPLSGNTLTHW